MSRVRVSGAYTIMRLKQRLIIAKNNFLYAGIIPYIKPVFSKVLANKNNEKKLNPFSTLASLISQ